MARNSKEDNTTQETAETIPADGGPPRIDIFKCSPSAFRNLVEEFGQWSKENPIDYSTPLPFPDNGWYDVAPETALDGLRRNPPKANRNVDFPTVLYYAKQMRDGQWMKTGQSLLFTTDGLLLDGQHREWAGYLSGVTFPTFVVMDVPAQPQLFAYVDNARPRTPKAALETAGYHNATQMHQILHMYDAFEHGLYTPTRTLRQAKNPPINVLGQASSLPYIQLATDLATATFADANQFLRHRRDIVGFMCLWLLTNGASEDVLHSFFGDFTAADYEEYTGKGQVEPVIWLRWFLARDAKKETRAQLAYHQLLGYMIVCFNKWQTGELVSKLNMAVGGEFPKFDDPTAELKQAAQ